MNTSAIRYTLSLILLNLATSSVRADTLIIVNSGPHRSADVAGHTEAKVNWLDADTTDDTACTESFAALELQHYLQKITGRYDDFDTLKEEPAGAKEDLILVGSPASNAALQRYAEKLGLDLKQIAELGPEGYCIKSLTLDGRRVTVVAGGSRVGTLYAAYDLLHRLGCRWFSPGEGEAHEEMPRIEKIPGMDVTERPSFALRRFHSWEERLDPGTDFLLWMARNRLNSWSLVEEKAGLMRKLGIQMSVGSHMAETMFLDPATPYPYDHPKFEGDEKKPKDPYAASDLYRGDADKNGMLSYFEAHPEWYAMVQGRRIPGINKQFGWNYCTSNRDATAEFLKNYVQAIVKGPYRQGDVILFWTLDVKPGKWCECPECKSLGIPTDRYLRLVYQFDQEIKKAQKSGKINRPIVVRFMIYRDVIDPPTRPLPADFDYATCTGTFFPNVRCYQHVFTDSECSMNAKFQKNLCGWALDSNRYYRGPVGIGEYYNIHRFRCLPLCLMHSMAIDIPYFYKVAGARQFDYMHATTENWGNKSLTNYQMARQLWNVDTDCEALWQDYFTGRYGLAAGVMRNFYETLEKINFNEIKSVLTIQLQKGANDLFPTSHLRYDRKPGVLCEGPTFVENVGYVKACRKLLDEARATKLPERIAARLAGDDGMFTYGERTIAFYDALVQSFMAVRAEDREEARRRLADARRIAELLRQDTTSALYSWDHVKKPNTLEASGCEGTLGILEKLIGAEDLDAAK